MSRDVGGFVRSVPTLYAQLFCWLVGGLILYGIYARFGQEKSRSRSPEKFVQASMMQSHFFRVSTPTMRFHLHNAMTSLWANREKDGKIKRLYFARAQTLLYKRSGKA